MVGAWKVSWEFSADDEQIAFAISFRSRTAPASDDPEGLDPLAPVAPPAPASEPTPFEVSIAPRRLEPPPPEPLPTIAEAIEPTPSELVPVDALSAAPPPAPDDPTPPPALPFAGPVATIDTLHATSDVPAAAPELGTERRDGAPATSAPPPVADGKSATDAPPAAAPAPVSAPPPQASPPPRPGEVTSDTDVISEAATDFAAQPVYPKRAVDLGLEGEVTLLAQVLADGHVESCEIETSSGHELLDESARKALRKWRFKPRRTNGVAHPFVARVPFRFYIPRGS